jgi:molybdopterin-containing oxidoreductase family membrane subunit
LIIAMALLRHFLQLEQYLLPLHFDKLGKLLLTMSLIWGYFTFNERLMVWYGNLSHEMVVLNATLTGEWAHLFWLMVVLKFVVPVLILSVRRLRTITGCVVTSCGVVVGMWLERFLIVIPSQSYQRLPYSWGTYAPRWPEITIMIAAIAGMILLYVLFAKFVPIISIWELKEGASTSKARRENPGAVAEETA